MMGRTPCHDKESGLKKGPWTPDEDRELVDYIKRHGHGSWRALPKLAGLNRCGKSCRLRWTNYLRPDIKRGKFSEEEEQLIINLHAVLGNKWSAIAGHLPGRTDNEIKNFWNTHLRKKLLQMGLDPVTHQPRTDHIDLLSNLHQLLAAANIVNSLITTNTNWDINNNNVLRFQSNHATQLQMLQNMVQLDLLNNSNNPFGTISSSLPNGLYEALGLNQSKIQNLYNNVSIDFPSQNQSNFQEFEAIQFQEKVDNEKLIGATNSPSSSTPLNYYSLPKLVSASSSPECSIVKEMELSKVNSNDDPSSNSSTTFEMLADLMYEEASDAYWKDIIDQDL